MTLSRTVKTQWTQRLRFCFRARQPCERNFKRPQGQELSTELDRHERTKLRRWRTERHVPPRSDPVNSDANANLIAILGAIPGLIQSLGSLCIWTLDEIRRSMESMEPIPPFCSISLCGFSAVCCWKTLLFLDWTWLSFGFDWFWILDDLGRRSSLAVQEQWHYDCLRLLGLDFSWPSLCRTLHSLHSWRVSNGFEMFGVWTVWLVAPSWCTSGNGRRAKKANNKRLAKREVFKHQVSHWLTMANLRKARARLEDLLRKYRHGDRKPAGRNVRGQGAQGMAGGDRYGRYDKASSYSQNSVLIKFPAKRMQLWQRLADPEAYLTWTRPIQYRLLRKWWVRLVLHAALISSRATLQPSQIFAVHIMLIY